MSIQVNGMSMRLRDNCEYVICQSFNYDRAMYYWIDAICIDQDSADEKKGQVAMMGDIFESAGLVLCSLGMHAGDIQLLSQVIKKKRPLLRRMSRNLKRWRFERGKASDPYLTSFYLDRR